MLVSIVLCVPFGWIASWNSGPTFVTHECKPPSAVVAVSPSLSTLVAYTSPLPPATQCLLPSSTLFAGGVESNLGPWSTSNGRSLASPSSSSPTMSFGLFSAARLGLSPNCQPCHRYWRSWYWRVCVVGHSSSRWAVTRWTLEFHRGRYLAHCCSPCTAVQWQTSFQDTVSSTISTPMTLSSTCECTPTTPPRVSDLQSTLKTFLFRQTFRPSQFS